MNPEALDPLSDKAENKVCAVKFSLRYTCKRNMFAFLPFLPSRPGSLVSVVHSHS
jgi:hypothetical protein